jgi:hypothetical protein
MLVQERGQNAQIQFVHRAAVAGARRRKAIALGHHEHQLGVIPNAPAQSAEACECR